MSIFNEVPQTKISRSTHNLSHQTKGTYDGGPIYPLMAELCFPGDSWRVRLEQFIRTMPMIAPILDRVDVKVDSFFVPLRLLWDDWEDFITLGPTGEFSAVRPTISYDSITPSATDVPFLNKVFGIGGLSDYLNFPTNQSFATGTATTKIVLDALPFRAYQLIYNEYFANETIDTPVNLITSSGDTELSISHDSSYSDSFLNFMLRYRGWRKDYFTSALPTPQKGPAVKIPFGDVVIDASEDPDTHAKRPLMLEGDAYDINWDGVQYNDQKKPVGENKTRVTLLNAEDSDTTLHYYSGLKANLDSSTLPTIEELRYAECLQEYYETNARGGSRYKEHLLNIWHTRSKDARLDRPEYLGGYRGPVTISDIDQTSQSDISAQGTMAGKGLSAGGNKLFKYHVPEWGIIMVVMSIVPKSAYCQGFRKWNLYDDVFDWPCPFFANLGEQEIKNKEIYDDPTDGLNDGTFGYTPRYAEAKFIPDSVHGQLRSTLAYWHLGRMFGSRPNLNSAFLHIHPDELARIFPLQVSNNDKFIGTFFFHVKRRMYLPYWGIPRLIHSV